MTGTASPAQVVANGTSTSTITITVKDSFGNPIAGIEPELIVVSANPEGPIIVQPTQATNTSGQTTAKSRALRPVRSASMWMPMASRSTR